MSLSLCPVSRRTRNDMEAFVPADLLASTEDTRSGRKRSSAARIHCRRWSVSRCVRRSTLRRLAAAPTRRYRRWPESTYRRAAAPNISRRLAPIMSTIAASRRCSSNTGASGAYRYSASFSLPESGKARGKNRPALGGTEYRLMPSACRLIVRAKL